MNKADTSPALMNFLFCGKESQLNSLIPEQVKNAMVGDYAMLWEYITQETPNSFENLGKALVIVHIPKLFDPQ